MLDLTCAVPAKNLQMGKVLDVRRGAGNSEQSGQVGVWRVGRKSQSSALEMNQRLMSETLKSGIYTDIINYLYVEFISSI